MFLSCLVAFNTFTRGMERQILLLVFSTLGSNSQQQLPCVCDRGN